MVREFKNNPNVVAVSYNEGGRFGEDQEWLETFWSNYYLRGSVLFDATGDNSRQKYDQPNTGLPVGRGFIIDQEGNVAMPYFGHQPDHVIQTIYALLGGTTNDPGISIPHVTGGADDWRNVLSVDNLANTSAAYTIILYDAFGVRVYDKTFSIGQLEFKTHDLKLLAPNAVCGRILAASPQLNFRVTFEHLGNSGLAESNLTGQPSAELALNFANNFPSVADWKGIAVMNMGMSSAPVNLYAIGGGQVLGVAYASIAPNSNLKGLHNRWFPSLKTSDIERIVVTSEDGQLIGMNITGNSAASRLLSAPAVPLSGFMY